MPRVSRSNVPKAVLRWSIDRAAIEFKISQASLRKSLGKIGAEPDNGCFSTSQIVDALFGEMHQEKLRTQKQITRKLELENSITTGSVLNWAALSAAFAQVADAMVHRITVSSLTRHEKEDLLRELSEIPVTISNVAHAQTRLPRGNGETAHVDDDES